MIHKVHNRYVDLSRLIEITTFDDSTAHHYVHGYAFSFEGAANSYKLRISALSRPEQEQIAIAIDRLKDAQAAFSGRRPVGDDASFIFREEPVNLADLI